MLDYYHAGLLPCWIITMLDITMLDYYHAGCFLKCYPQLDSLFPDLSPKKQPKIKPTGEKRKERRRRNSAPYEKRPLLIRRNPTRDAR